MKFTGRMRQYADNYVTGPNEVEFEPTSFGFHCSLVFDDGAPVALVGQGRQWGPDVVLEVEQMLGVFRMPRYAVKSCHQRGPQEL